MVPSFKTVTTLTDMAKLFCFNLCIWFRVKINTFFQLISTYIRIVIALRVRGHFQRCENFRIDEEIVLISRRVFYHPPCCNIPNNPPPYRLRTFKQLLKSLIHKINALFVVMGSSWNFPARASSSYESSESSRAGALQFSSWNRADNTDNMHVKK